MVSIMLFGLVWFSVWLSWSKELWVSILGFVFVVCSAWGLYFQPYFIASDVSEHIPEIADLKKNNRDFMELKIPHPAASFILGVNLFFGWSGLGWLTCFVWAHAPGTVEVPDEALTALVKQGV